MTDVRAKLQCDVSYFRITKGQSKELCCEATSDGHEERVIGADYTYLVDDEMLNLITFSTYATRQFTAI